MATFGSDNFEPDRPVADRLARLGAMPVDTTRLDRFIESKIPRPRSRWGWSGRGLRAAAAVVLVTALLGLVVWNQTGAPVMASVGEMAMFHRQMVQGTIPVTQVDSIQEASQALSDQWPSQPGVPEAPGGHVMACCMREIKDKKMIGVLVRKEGQLVTISVARASDLRSPAATTLVRDGQAYHVESAGALHMVSTRREGRWICLMGELPPERLVEMAAALKFR